MEDSLVGADVTPDDNSLYVAEDASNGIQGVFYQVNLNNGAVTNAPYTLNLNETGSWDIAVTGGGKAFVTTHGSARPFPLRELDLHTNTYTTRTDDPGSGGGGMIAANSLIQRSADRSEFFFTEANNNSGPFFLYNANTDTFSAAGSAFIPLNGTSPAVNRNGTLFALEDDGGASVFDAHFNSLINLAGLTGGIAFDPSQDMLYGVNPTTDLIYAYDTNTWALKYTLSVGESIGASSDFGTGIIVVSPDDQYLFLTTPSGVREYSLPQPTGVASSLGVSGFPQFITNGITGTVTVTALDPAGNVATGYRGTVHFSSTSTGALPPDYTFTAGDNGTHTFNVTLTTTGTQSLTVTDPANSLSGGEGGIVVHDYGTNYIPIQNYRDLVYDPTRDLLYITTGDGLVQRFDPYTETLLAPYQVGDSLEGADITLDGGSSLFVADGVHGVTQGWVHDLNLNTGAVTNATYPLTATETGTYDVGIAANGKGMVTLAGTGGLPVYELDVATNTLRVRTDAPGSLGGGLVDPGTAVASGADHTYLAVAELQNGVGPLFAYSSRTDVFLTPRNLQGTITRPAVSRDGSLISENEGDDEGLYDQIFHLIAGEEDGVSDGDGNPDMYGGSVFDPLLNVVYVADIYSDDNGGPTQNIVALDTSQWQHLYQIPIGAQLPYPIADYSASMMAISSDGAVLFLDTPTEIRLFYTRGFLVHGYPSPTVAGTPGNVTVTAVNPDGTINTSYTGTVHFTSSDTRAGLPKDYTFTAADNGTHVFSVVLATAGSESITVTDTATSVNGSQLGINVLPAAPDHLVFIVQPTNNKAQQTFNPVIEVEIFDRFGNQEFNDYTDQITLAFGNNPGGGSLSGNTTVTVNGGVAAFYDLEVDTVASGYTLTATLAGVPVVTSDPFNITPGVPNYLVFSEQPSNTLAGSAINPAVVVEELDATGNLETGDNSTVVTLSIASGPGNFTSGSTTAVTVSGGVATFSNLVLDTAGNYVLAENATGKLSGPNSKSFTINPAAPDHLAFAVGPSTTLAGAAISPPVKVNVLDQYNNVVTTDNVDQITLTVASGPGGFDPNSTTTVPVNAGVALFSNLIFDTAGSYTLSETSSGGQTGPVSSSFTIIPAAADHLAFSVQPSDTTAGAVISPTVKVKIIDRFGNLLTTDNTDQVTLTVATGPAGVSGGGTVTVSGGVATFSGLVLDTVGNYVLAENSTGGVTGANSTAFTVKTAPANHLIFTVQPSTTTAGVAINPAVTVEVLDAYGNFVSSDNSDLVIMAVSTGPGSFDSASTLTGQVTGGVATFSNLILETAGSYTLFDRTAGGLTGPFSNSFTVTSTIANHLGFTTQPGNTTAGAAITPPVTVGALDRFGNVVSTYNNDQVTISLASGPSGFDGSSTTTVAVQNGVATFGNLIFDVAGNYSLNAIAASGLTGPISNTFSVSAGAANYLVFNVQPSSTTAGAAINPAVQVQVFDKYGNLRVAGSDQVTVSVANGPGGFDSASTTTVGTSGGTATFSNLKFDTAGVYSLGASTAGGVSGPNSVNFSVSPAAPNHLVFDVEPDTTSAGVADSPAVKVMVCDTYGNLVTADNSDQVTLSIASGPGKFDPVSTTTATVSGGIATFGNLILDTAGVYTLAENATGGLTGLNSLDFIVNPTAPDHLVFSVQPTNSAEGVAISPPIVVTIFDKYGNVETTDYSDVLTLAVASGPGGFAAGSTTSFTVVAGVATFSSLTFDTFGTYMLGASATGGATDVSSSSFSVSPGAPDHLAFSIQPSDTTAGAAIGPAVQVRVFDHYGNLLTNDNADQITLSVASGPSGFAAGSTSTVTVHGGIGTFSNLVFDTAGSFSLSQRCTGGVSGPNSDSFTVNPAAADHLAFSVQPSNTAADTAITSTVQVQIFDRFGNLLTNDNSDQVTVSIASGPGGFTADSTPMKTVINGVGTFTNLFLETAGKYSLCDSWSGGVSGPNSNPFTITPGASDHLDFGVEPTDTTAGAAISPAVQVQVLDPYGNLISDDNSDQVTLIVASGPTGFTGDSTTTVTVSGGIATFNNLVLDTSGTYTLSETCTSGLNGPSSSSFTVSAVNTPNHLAFTIQPTDTLAGKRIAPAVQAELLDQYDNVLTADNSDQVTLSVVSGPGTITSGGTVTVSGGIATFNNLIFDTAGTYTLAESATGGATGPDSSTFTVNPDPVADHLGFGVEPSDTVAGTAISPPVQVEVLDQYGNVLTFDNSDQVTLSVTGGPGGFDASSTTSMTVSGGIAIFGNLVLDTEGSYSLAATTAGGLTGQDSTSFTISAAALDHLTFGTQPSDTAAGSFISPAVKVQLVDRFGNVLSSDNSSQVSVALLGGGSLGGTKTATVANGVATFDNLTIDQAGGGYVLAATSGSQEITSAPFSVTGGPATHLVISSPPPDSITAGTDFTVVVNAEDNYGNIDATFPGSVTVSLAGNSDSSSLGGTLTVGLINGVATYSDLTLTLAGPGNPLAFAAPGLPAITTQSLTVTPAPATRLVLVSAPAGLLTANTDFNMQLAAEDPFGNVDPTFTGTVAVTLADNPADGTLGGPQTGSAQTGLVSFTGLTLSQGGPYGLNFSGGTLKPATPSVTALAYQHSLPAVIEDTSNPAGVKVSALLLSNYRDSDPNSKPGIAVTATSGTGVWQYSSNGRRWLNVGSVSAGQALLLPASYQVRFVPALHWTGHASIIFIAWDGSQGQAGGFASTAQSGGTSAFSLAPAEGNVTVTPINHAPSWLPGSAALTPVLPGDVNPPGDSVSSIFASNFQDIDGGTVPGVAVVGLTGIKSGTWQYSTNDGSTWNPFGSPSLTAARLLSGNDLIRFVPSATTGVGVVTLQAYAWDQTSGNDTQTANLKGKGKTGGQTAFSTTLLTAGFAINDAPVLSSTLGPPLSDTSEDVPSAAVPVATLLTNESDPDPGSRAGVGVVDAAGPGTWQYSLNGTTWLSMGRGIRSTGTAAAERGRHSFPAGTARERTCDADVPRLGPDGGQWRHPVCGQRHRWRLRLQPPRKRARHSPSIRSTTRRRGREVVRSCRPSCPARVIRPARTSTALRRRIPRR